MIIDHVRSIRTGVWNKARWLRAWALVRMRQNRGATYFGEVYAFFRDGSIFMIPIGVMNSYTGPHLGFTIPVYFSFLFMICFFMTTYVVGYYDQYKLRLWQVESEIGMREINPFWQRNEKLWVRLEQKIDSLEKELEEVKVCLKKKR